MNVLTCTKCGFEGPDEEFPHDKRNGKRRHRSSWCRECYRRKHREYMAAHPEKKKEHDTLYYERHRGVIRDKQVDARLRLRYGITELDYEAMVVAQKSLCMICQRRHDRLHMDHDHETGEVRGLLCGVCNRMLGALENKEWHVRAQEYLDG